MGNISNLLELLFYMVIGAAWIFMGANKKYTNDEVNESEGCQIKNIKKYTVATKIMYYIVGVLIIIPAIIEYGGKISGQQHTILTAITFPFLCISFILYKIYISKNCKYVKKEEITNGK